MNDVRKRGSRAASGVSKSFQNVGKQMRRTGTIMTAAVTAPVIAGMHKMTNEAALLEGAMAKFNVVFGDASDDMQAWVKEFRKEVPLATRDIVKHASAMQDLLVPMGIARDEATGMSKDWLELASALAAFNDVPVEQALEAIRSGVAGMSRPLRQFGIDARQTALEQTALEEGLISAGEEMNTQVRQQALLIKATQQSKDAIDGYAAQQDSLLLIQQEVTASVKDLAASFGELLIPRAKQVGEQIASAARWITNLDESTKKTILSVAGIAAAIGPVLVGIGSLIKLLPVLGAGFTALTGPVGLTVAAVAGAATAIISNWDEIKAYFTTGGGATFWNTTKMIATTTMQAITSTISFVVAEIKNIWGAIVEYFTNGDGSAFWESLKTTTASVLNATVEIIKSVIGTIETIWAAFGPTLIKDFKHAWEAIKIITSTAGKIVFNVFRNVLDQITNMINFWRGVFTGDWQLVWDSVKNIVITAVNGVISTIESLVTGSIDLLINFLDRLGVGDAIKESLRAGRKAIEGLTEDLKLARVETEKNAAATSSWSFSYASLAANAKAAAKAVKEANEAASQQQTIKPPEHDIIEGVPSMDFMEQGMGVDTERLFPTDTLKGMNQQMQHFQDKMMRLPVQSEAFTQAKKRAGDLRGQIKDLQGTQKKAGQLGQQMGMMVGNALQAAVFEGKKLGDVVKTLIQQFASQLFVTGIASLITGGGVGLFGSIFSGLFHKGGIVPGSGDQPIMAEGGEGVFTRDQMKAMGGMMRTGNNNSMNAPTQQLTQRDIQHAFEKASKKMFQKLGPREIFAMSQRGSIAY